MRTCDLCGFERPCRYYRGSDGTYYMYCDSCANLRKIYDEEAAKFLLRLDDK